MEKLETRWNNLTPREQKRFIARVVIGGSIVAGLSTVLGVGIVTYAAEHRDTPVVPAYPRIQEENDLLRLARLAPRLARVTLFSEPETEEQKDVLWRDIFESLQKEPQTCYWTLAGKVHENPASFLFRCNSY